MIALGWKKLLNKWVFLCSIFWLMGSFMASGNLVFLNNNVTESLVGYEADFAPSIKWPGKNGTLHLAEPLDACSTLTNNIVQKSNDTKSSFVLIIRGGCDFDDKVRRAQAAGFRAAIVYDTEDEDLFPMNGNSAGIKIHAVIVSRASGKTLAKYAGASDMELWIIPVPDNLRPFFFAIPFIIVVFIFALILVIQTYHRSREEPPQALYARFPWD